MFFNNFVQQLAMALSETSSMERFLIFLLFLTLFIMFIEKVEIKRLYKENRYLRGYIPIVTSDNCVKHVCDKRYDGMCVECQLNAGRAIIDGILKQKS